LTHTESESLPSTTRQQSEYIYQIMACEARVKLKQKDLIAYRFDQGEWIAKCYDSGMSTDDIFEATGISKVTIRECFRFYEHPQFGKNKARLLNWLQNSDTLYWYHVQALIKSDRDPDVITKEEWIKRGIRYIEGAGRRIEEMTEHLTEDLDPDLMAQAEGAITAFIESAYQMAELSGRDDLIPRSKEHLDWIDEQPCEATGVAAEDVTHHHVGTEGTAEKTSDYLTIPVRHNVHEEIHQHGHKWVEKRYNFSILRALVRVLHKRLTGVYPVIPRDL